MEELFAVSFVIVPLILNIAMLVSVSKEPDERAVLIRTKAMRITFIGMNGFVSYHVIQMFIEAFRDVNNAAYSGLNPILLLGFVSISYFLSLLYYKKKFGG